MASFNEPYEKKQEETYLNYSRGADAPSPLRTPIAMEADTSALGFGKVALGAVEAKDILYRDRIQKEITAEVDAHRDPIIGASTGQGSPDANVPADLRRQIERMNALADANEGGEIAGRGFWMQMENIARATRGRYPGYREYIDNTVARLTGGTPANVLRNLVEKAATDSRDSEAKRRDWVEKQLTKFGRGSSYTSKYTTDELYDELAQQELVDKSSERRRNNLTERSQNETVDAKEFSNAASLEVTKRLALTKKEMADDFLRARDTAINQASSGPLTGKALEDAQVKGLQYKNSVQELVSGILDQYPDLRPEDRKAIITNAIAEVDTEIGAIVSGNTNLAEAMAIRNKLIQDEDDYEIMRQDRSGFLRVTGALNRQGGQALVTGVLAYNKDALGNKAKLYTMDFILGQLDENRQPTAISDHAKRIANEPTVPEAERGRSIDAAVQNQIDQLTGDIGLTGEQKARIATGLFGPGNENFLKTFYSGDDVAIFQRLQSPEMIASLEEVRKTRPEVYRMYEKWRDTSFKYLYSTELDTMKTIVVDRASMNLSQGPDGRFEIEYIPTEQQIAAGVAAGRTAPATDAAFENVAAWFSGAEQSVNTVNAAIDALRPGWEAEGKDANQEISKLLTLSGVDLNAAKTPFGPSSLFAAFGEYLFSSVKGMAGDVSTFINSENRSNLGMGSRDQQTPEQTAEFRRQLKANQPEINRIGNQIEQMELDGTAQTDPETYQNLLIDFQILTQPGSEQGSSRIGGPVRAGDPLGLPTFAGEGFANAVRYTPEQQKQQLDAVTGIGQELRELYSLLSNTTDPETRQMIKEDIQSLRTNGQSPIFSVGKNLGIYQSEINSKNTRGTPEGELPFSSGRAQRNNPTDTLTGEQGIQDIVEFLKDKEYVPGERISQNVVDATIKNEAEAKSVIDEWFRLRDQAIALARTPGGNPQQHAAVVQDAKMYNRIIGDLIRKWPGTYPEVYEMIQRIDRGEERIRRENSVDGAIEGR